VAPISLPCRCKQAQHHTSTCQASSCCASSNRPLHGCRLCRHGLHPACSTSTHQQTYPASFRAELGLPVHFCLTYIKVQVPALLQGVIQGLNSIDVLFVGSIAGGAQTGKQPGMLGASSAQKCRTQNSGRRCQFADSGLKNSPALFSSAGQYMAHQLCIGWGTTRDVARAGSCTVHECAQSHCWSCQVS
jgi:hypothetical protein